MCTEDGKPIHSACGAAAALAVNWSPVFNRAVEDGVDMNRFLEYGRPVGEGLGWEWRRGRARNLPAVAHDSAPGQGWLAIVQVLAACAGHLSRDAGRHRQDAAGRRGRAGGAA